MLREPFHCARLLVATPMTTCCHINPLKKAPMSLQPLAKKTFGTIQEPARTIDVVHRTDVLVVGSGPGGLAAALAAARTGVKVTLVERFGCFGGNLTAVGVEGFA